MYLISFHFEHGGHSVIFFTHLGNSFICSISVNDRSSTTAAPTAALPGYTTNEFHYTIHIVLVYIWYKRRFQNSNIN